MDFSVLHILHFTTIHVTFRTRVLDYSENFPRFLPSRKLLISIYLIITWSLTQRPYCIDFSDQYAPANTYQYKTTTQYSYTTTNNFQNPVCLSRLSIVCLHDLIEMCRCLQIMTLVPWHSFCRETAAFSCSYDVTLDVFSSLLANCGCYQWCAQRPLCVLMQRKTNSESYEDMGNLI